MNVQLETERLNIRPLMIKDVDFIIQLLNSKGWIQFIGERNIKCIESANNYINKILLNKNFFYNVFEIKETKEPIGIVTFLHRDEFDSPDIGYAMLPNFEKKGYALEATKHYLAQVQNTKSIEKVIAITLPGNSNSINLLEKLGLKYESSFFEDQTQLSLYSIVF